MKRTHPNKTGNNYDDLNLWCDWGEEIDMRFYDPETYKTTKIEGRLL